MKKVIIVLLLFIVSNNFSQELNLPVYTQYLADNPFVISPTFAGIGDNLRVRANGLTQWVGIKNAPDNAAVYADMRIADRSGVGLSLYSDKNGFTRQAGAKFSFAQHIILDYYSEQYLSFGLSFNYNNFRIDIDQFDKGIFDPAIVNDKFNANNNFDVSALYRYKKFYLSFNAANILKKDINKFKGVEPYLLNNYQVYTGYVFKNDGLDFEPSVFYQLFQSDGRSSTDINLKLRKFDSAEGYFWGGLSYRFLNDQPLKPLNVGPMFGFKKSNFYFGYSYQVTLNEFVNYNSGTHAVTIGIDFFQGLSNCPCTQYMTKD